MEELLAALLYGVAEILCEVLAELFAETVVAAVVRFFRKMIDRSLAIPSILAIPAYLLFGVAVGAVSVLVYPHPLVHPSRIHGISLLISPVITGLLMSFMGWELRRRKKQTVRIESFKFGFTFALGMAIVRLIFTR